MPLFSYIHQSLDTFYSLSYLLNKNRPENHLIQPSQGPTVYSLFTRFFDFFVTNQALPFLIFFNQTTRSFDLCLFVFIHCVFSLLQLIIFLLLLPFHLFTQLHIIAFPILVILPFLFLLIIKCKFQFQHVIFFCISPILVIRRKSFIILSNLLTPTAQLLLIFQNKGPYLLNCYQTSAMKLVGSWNSSCSMIAIFYLQTNSIFISIFVNFKRSYSEATECKPQGS
eukprot:TRINITY_DN42353_c1_g1_i2.p1 TRINITY_DN42353_c1_g1~~TRINITY_DN42353_c1_g1_i2.p1  ORF type:complete len:225 (-),score=-28.75 TRINITY_DN42353_c1_g1_i2:43-717(-)